ncbi:MAG: acyloxyacyl hydrolase [Deltaproteobacteria bacterium]|nr:acyloxyacyl hydrolase [Deltaproteobacteria bacterium]
MKFDLILPQSYVICLLITAMVIFYCPVSLSAQGNNGYVPTKSGISLNSAYTYDPSDNICFLQASVFRLYDYDRVWKHKAPDNLRFKVEGAVGSARLDNNDVKLIANAGVLALLYLDRFETDFIKPYLEAGIGVIYTDYRVKGQDYRFNFNPQAGIGIEFKRKGNQNRFILLRMHHISNGGFGSLNRGQNSIVFAFGQYF